MRPRTDFHICSLQAYDALERCVALQREVWGAAYADVVPASVLLVAGKMGGLVAGAFSPEGELVGFVYGLTGFYEGRPAHWSDLLAVRAAWRGRGVGLALKRYQRERMLEAGLDRILWSYDPLLAHNAGFNLERLGARVDGYVRDMYGADSASALHRGIGLDRFVVSWPIREEGVRRRIEEAWRPKADPARDAPLVGAATGASASPGTRRLPLPDDAAVRVEIPPDVHALQRSDVETARRWRAVTRRAFEHYLTLGYSVDGFVRDAGRCYYVLRA